MLIFQGQWHIFLASFLTFLVLNTIENLIHYNIGRTSEQGFHFYNPRGSDWVRIIFTMIGFGLLQAGLTILLDYLFFMKKKV